MSERLFPLVMADVAMFCLEDQRLRLLLTRRARNPVQGGWSLPGGILRPDEDDSVDDTARRVLREKVGLDTAPLEQVRVFSGPTRDERGWSLSVLYTAVVLRDQAPAAAGHKTEAVAWVDPAAPGVDLVFDHAAMVQAALQALRAKVRDRALPLHLFKDLFTLTELQQACEAVLDTAMDKAAFRRRLKEREGIDFEIAEGKYKTGRQRPAQYYRATGGFVF